MNKALVFAAAATAMTILVHPGYAAGPGNLSALETLLNSIRQNRFSDGFEFRMNVSTVLADGRAANGFKIAVIGQIGTDRDRVVINGISPDYVRNRHIAAERRSDNGVHALEWGGRTPGGRQQMDAYSGFFDSNLIVWDLLEPWWNWPRQTLGGIDHALGQECILVTSESDGGPSPIHAVTSCVDPNSGLAMKTRLFDAKHHLVRSFVVEQTMRTESGVLTAKKITITSTDKSATSLEIYSGDEHYTVNPDTFSALDSRPAGVR